MRSMEATCTSTKRQPQRSSSGESFLSYSVNVLVAESCSRGVVSGIICHEYGRKSAGRAISFWSGIDCWLQSSCWL